MKKKINKLIKNAKKTIMIYPVTFISFIIYTIFLSIAFDNLPDEILMALSVFVLIFCLGTLNVELKVKNNKQKAPAFIGCILSGLAFGIIDFLINIEIITSVSIIKYFYMLTLTVSIVLALLYILFNHQKLRIKFEEYIKYVTFELVETTFKYGVLAIGTILLTTLFSVLITELDTTYLRLQLLVWGCYFMPNAVLAFRYKKKDYTKLIKILFNDILSVLLLTSYVIVYCYILKIIFALKLPSNEVFGILSFLFLVGAPIWIVNSTIQSNKIWNKPNKYLPYLFIPFIILQSLSLGLRIVEYGITETRYLGVVLIIIEIIYEILYISKKRLYYIIYPIIGLAIVTFIFPFINMNYLSCYSQYLRFDKLYKNKEASEYSISSVYEYFTNDDYKEYFISSKYSEDEIKSLNQKYCSYNNIFDYNNYNWSLDEEEIDIEGYKRIKKFEISEVEEFDYKNEIDNLLNDLIESGKIKNQDSKEPYTVDINNNTKLVLTYLSIEMKSENKFTSYYVEGYILTK